jgi:hypothetical protein
VLTYNSGTGAMTVDVNHHTGSGTYSAWVINVGGVTPQTSVAWGGITGTLSSQTDLQSALNAKANLSGATFTGKVNLATISASSPSVNLGGQCDSAPASAMNGDLWISNAASPKITYRTGGINYNLAVLNQFNTFTGQMVINTTSSSTAALRVTQLGTANAIEVEDSTTPDSTRFAVDQFGKVGIGVAPDANAALKVDTNGIMFGDGTTQYTAAGSPGSIPNNPSLEKIWFIFNYFNYITSWSYDSIYNQTTVYHTGPDSAIRSFSNGFILTDGNYTFGLNNNETPGVIIWNGDITDGGLGRNLYVKNGDSFLQQITKYFN